MSDEPWGTYGAYQSAASAMLAALKRVRITLGLSENSLRNELDTAIAQAKAAGVDATEEQGVESRRRTSEPPSSTGGRTETLMTSRDLGCYDSDISGDLSLTYMEWFRARRRW